MMPSAIDYRQQIEEELRLVSDEKLADLAKIVHVFTEDLPEARLARACEQARNNDIESLDLLLGSLDD